MNPPLLQRWRARLADRGLHEFLWYCVPAVVVGLLIRAALTWGMPYGQYHYDTPDFLQTAADLVERHRLTLHYKKTFLTPLLYTLPFLVHLPALVVIPLGQHALGLALIPLAGALCRLWFVCWRWLIVPLTVLIAVQPALLWFEHTLLAESQYVFGVVAVAVAGSLFARRPSRERLAFLFAALLITAGARPEGRLFLGFGILLVLAAYHGRWRVEIRKLAATAGFCVFVALITRTGQAGVLLYASLLHLAPDQSRVAPEISECLRPLRERLRQERAARVLNDVVRTEKQLTEQILAGYAPQHPELHLENPKRLSGFCLKLAVETARAHPLALPRLACDRFLARIDEDSGGRLSAHDVLTRQARALERGADKAAALGPGLAGEPLADRDQIEQFVLARYDPQRIAWFNRWEANWQHALDDYHLPDVTYSAQEILPGLPWFYVFALLGAVLAVTVPSPIRLLHQTFLPVLGGVWFMVMVTGALMPRYRFVLEPFWLLYLGFLPDGIGRVVRHFWPTRAVRSVPSNPPAESVAIAT